MVERTDKGLPDGYPAIAVYTVYGKRWMTGKTFLCLMAGVSVYGVWMRPEKDRYSLEISTEWMERHQITLPYQQSEANARLFLSAYKRHRFEQECLMKSGVVGLTPEYRKFFYHDDVWRPPFVDVFANPVSYYGGFWTSYSWHLGYF
jgi:hypothetical protein